jgi:hypothetical protein
LQLCLTLAWRRRLESEGMNAIEFLLAVAKEAAAAQGWAVCCERSGLSEAVYVRVRRGNEWFGVRIASHAPVYESSADYEQVLVPLEVESAAAIPIAIERVQNAVISGGWVVADPAEVDDAIRAARLARRHGARVKKASRTTWEWSEPLQAWQLIGVGNRLPKPEEVASLAHLTPKAPPCVRAGALEESAIRHRHNALARWAHEEGLRWAERPEAVTPPDAVAPEALPDWTSAGEFQPFVG